MLDHDRVFVHNGVAVFLGVRMTYSAGQRVNVNRTGKGRPDIRMNTRVPDRIVMLARGVFADHVAVVGSIREALSGRQSGASRESDGGCGNQKELSHMKSPFCEWWWQGNGLGGRRFPAIDL